MGKGRKKRGTKSGIIASVASRSLRVGEEGLLLEVTAEDSHSSLLQEQAKPAACKAEKTNSVIVDAPALADLKHKAPLDGEGSSFQASKKASSVPCHFFQRGYCRYGDLCRFQHLAAASASTEPLNAASQKSLPTKRDKAPPEKTCAPEECLDWHLTGSCPRYRTCRYAHSVNHGMQGCHKGTRSGMYMDSTMGLGGFEYIAAHLLREGLGRSMGRGRKDETAERMMNGGFTDDDVYELSLQGIKPWDPEAWDALAVLKGWDMDEGYDYDDSDYDYDGLGFY